MAPFLLEIQSPASNAQRGLWISALTVSFVPKYMNLCYTPFWVIEDLFNAPLKL